ncbi:MAG: patatin-like phospholipase family protein, partial [Cyanobacteria bacterium]|nr:patatin-like phospholipase family protein [Cyanobacteriota bacterium]
MVTSQSSKHHINLALQGGGSHGAFTWGVLDYFLSLNEIEIEGISGTSAGAMNAVILAEALEEKGASYAREALELFWREVSAAGQFSPFNYSPIDRMNGRWDLENSPAFVCFDWWSRLVSPYQFNPLNINPLQAILEKFVDFNHLKKCSKTQLFVSATNVRTGKVRVFENHELSSQVLLASACLPFLFQSVEVEGEYYWDGGYSGNPVLFPLLNNCHSRDVMIVQINPIERKKIPTTAREIINRMQEISFNASLIQEVHTIHLLNCL